VAEELMKDMFIELLIRENNDVEEMVHFATDHFFNLERET
jgi:hypothetical protein